MKENLNESVSQVSSGQRIRHLPRVKSSHNLGCNPGSWLGRKCQASLGTRKERHWAFKSQPNKDLLRTEGTDINKESLVLGIECMPSTLKNIFQTLSHFFSHTNIHPLGLQKLKMRTPKLKKQTKKGKQVDQGKHSQAWTGNVSTGILFIGSCLQTA